MGSSCRREPAAAFRGLAKIEPLEALLWHEDLTPDDQGRQGLRQAQRDGWNGLEVFCHILPYLTISPCGTADEQAVLIFQRYGQPVHLRLHVVLNTVSQGIPYTLVEVVQLFDGQDILKNQGSPVPDI